MERATRNGIQRATQRARSLLERELAEQLEGIFDIRRDGTIAESPGRHLTADDRERRVRLVAAVEHRLTTAAGPADAVATFVREAAFTALNRFVALKLLEARGLVQECVSQGDSSSGFREFAGLAPGLVDLPDRGYRLYLENLFDEIGREVGVLFDRRDPASLLWPDRQTLIELLEILNASDLATIWDEDETIGWVYQFFNSDQDRERARYNAQGKPKAPQNSYELAVRNQFFTPRYVVQFLVENTLGRMWLQMRGGDSRLTEQCEYLVRDDEPLQARPKRDPRDLKILDPACGSGHFLLYAFDLLSTIYGEAWDDPEQTASKATGGSLRDDYPDREELELALPTLILERNLYGIDIDARATQIAALALWLRAQRGFNDAGISRGERLPIRRTNVVVAEPISGDSKLIDEFLAGLQPALLGDLFRQIVEVTALAGDLGPLIRPTEVLRKEIKAARDDFVQLMKEQGRLPGFEDDSRARARDLTAVSDEQFFDEAEAVLLTALDQFATASVSDGEINRRLFADDAAHGLALIDVLRHQFDVVLMNPPFGAVTAAAKGAFERLYPMTRNDIYAAFVERGIELLPPGGMLGAITSRTGFFLSSFRRWREDVLLDRAPPAVFADLGYGVLDSAMVEVAAYCLDRKA